MSLITLPLRTVREIAATAPQQSRSRLRGEFEEDDEDLYGDDDIGELDDDEDLELDDEDDDELDALDADPSI